MRTLLFLTLVLPYFMGCNPADAPGINNTNKNEKMCTLIGGFTTIKVDITSSNPLPPNLALAFNGKSVDIDECNENPLYFWKPIKLNKDRTKVIINYDLGLNDEDYKFYIPEGHESPITSLLNLIVYNRDKCTHPLSLS